MPGSKRNKNASKVTKLKEYDLVEKAYDSFCEHLEEGYVKDSWCFEDKDNDFAVTFETFETYLEKYPIDFPPIKAKVARNKGYKKWEGVCMDSGNGTNPKASTASLQMIMRNKFGWDTDKKEQQTEHTTKVIGENFDSEFPERDQDKPKAD